MTTSASTARTGDGLVRRYRYGPERDHFGDLYLPAGAGPHPVALVIHGGCWRAYWQLDLMDSLCRDLASRGIAAWNVEYRRLGQGGGWPMSLIDVGAATDLLDLLSARYPLDLGRLVAIGHSAGGHLALWAAARHRLDPGAPGSDPVVRVSSVLVLAGISDLREGFRQGTCDHAVYELLGGEPDSLPDRYAHASPAELLPLGVPQVLVHGSADEDVDPSITDGYASLARASGDEVIDVRLEGFNHFDVIDPKSPIWHAALDAVPSFAAPSDFAVPADPE
ncbi:MAG TPA: alpha/beta hydrolase [Solirubrobacteraceae bacterium]|nr:alpha/beta hydrolase [Solirubrobacteraceae bacterium]